MDLKEFYFQNIKESEYHHRFLNSVKKVNYTYNLFTGEEETQDYQFEIYDVEEAITKFKELCQPDVNFSPENKCWFYLITYYLNRQSPYSQSCDLELHRTQPDPEIQKLLGQQPRRAAAQRYHLHRERLLHRGESG